MRRLNNNHRRSLSDLFFHILLGDFAVVDGIFFNVSNRETTFTWHRCKPFHICTTKYWHYRSIVRYNMEQKQTCVPSLDSLYRGESWKKNYFERITQHMSNFVTQALYRFGSIKTDCLSMAKRWVGIIKYRHIYISSNTQAKEEAWQREKEQAIIVIVSSLSYNNSKSYSNTVTTNYIDEWLPCNWKIGIIYGFGVRYSGNAYTQSNSILPLSSDKWNFLSFSRSLTFGCNDKIRFD